MKNLFSLKNKKIIIIKEIEKLGKQFTDTFLKSEAKKIIIIDIVKPKKNSKRIDYYQCDLSKETDLQKLLELIFKKEKQIQ